MLLEMTHPVVTPLAPLATDITRCRAMCVRHALLVRQMSPGIMLLEPTPNAMQLLAPKTKGCAAMRVWRVLPAKQMVLAMMHPDLIPLAMPSGAP
jgi:hypothetical protein